MQRSVYIIKPEAMRHLELIHSLIEKAGLRVAANAITTLPESAVDSLYPGIDQDLRAAMLHYFGAGPCEIGIVEGPNAIERLSKLAGSSVNPAECDRSTIRGRFGVQEAVRFRSAVYYLNGFHRSQNLFEVERDLALFHALTAPLESKRQ